jgi:hypothetical protein
MNLHAFQLVLAKKDSIGMQRIDVSRKQNVQK